MQSKKTQRQIKSERRAKRHYGMKVLSQNDKYCWMSVQNKHGWSLGLALEDYTLWLKNVRFANRKDIEKLIGGKKSIVFVELKGGK